MKTSHRHFTALLFAAVAIAASWSNHGLATTPPSRYTVSNGIVTDTKTGLTWQQTISPNSYTRANALTYCTNLDLNGTGWRAPSMKEIQTIVDDTRSNPALDPVAFPNTLGQPFWSSTMQGASTTFGWVLDFYRGNLTNRSITDVYQVRCVR